MGNKVSALKAKTLSEVTKELFRQAMVKAMDEAHSGCYRLQGCGENIEIFGQSYPRRKSLISFRDYRGNCEMLITNESGEFLFYGRLDERIGFEQKLELYWDIFQAVKSEICKSFSISKAMTIQGE